MTVVRHVNPVAPRRARDLVAEVYRQVETEFSGISAAVQMASPAPEILAPAWSLLRESRVSCEVSLTRKLLTGLGVAQANRCGYDEAAHLAVLRFNGEADLADQVASGGVPDDADLAELLGWARATGADSPVAETTPFGSRQAPEFFATVLFTHFINRLILAMLPPDLTPGGTDTEGESSAEDDPVWRKAEGRPEPGATLSLFDNTGTPPRWAAGTPAGVAYAALSTTAAMGAGLLSEDAQTVATETIAAHRGRMRADTSTILDGSLDGLSDEDKMGARLAILAGLAPSAITDADVVAWRATHRHLSDHCTVFLLTFGAMAAVGHIEADVT